MYDGRNSNVELQSPPTGRTADRPSRGSKIYFGGGDSEGPGGAGTRVVFSEDDPSEEADEIEESVSGQAGGGPTTAPKLKKATSTSAVLQIETKEDTYEFDLVGDPGLELIPMLNNKNACVRNIDHTKAPPNIHSGMRVHSINGERVDGKSFDEIIKRWKIALVATDPIHLVLVDHGDQTLTKSADVAQAVEWKKQMERQNYNQSLRNRALLLVDSLYFQIFIVICIGIDMAIIIIAPPWAADDEEEPGWINTVSWIVLVIYMLELAIRIYGLTPQRFFRKRFCVFDFIVVALCVFFAAFQTARFVVVLRGVRIIRILRIIRAGTRILTTVANRLPTAVRYKVRMNKMSFRDKDFNLDLCYITSRVISMSVPSTGREAVYRNPIESVVKFFEQRHRDRYMLYDLCLERSYDVDKFHGRVQHFKFTDHSVPTLTMMLRFCNSVQKWMMQHPENVIAVHCKGGKGRTGTMVCAWLLYRYRQSDAEDSIKYFADMRTNMSAGTRTQGIETSSQKRYVTYFWDYLHRFHGNLEIFKSPFGWRIKSIQIGPFYSDTFRRLSIDVFERQEYVKRDDPDEDGALPSLAKISADVTRGDRMLRNFAGADLSVVAPQYCRIRLDKEHQHMILRGNLRFDIYSIEKNGERKQIIGCWFNTYLEQLPKGGRPITVDKMHLDKAQKDKKHKTFPEDFTFQLQVVNTNRQHDTGGQNLAGKAVEDGLPEIEIIQTPGDE